MFGRRDRCLLVLSQLAGVPYKHLRHLTAGDVTVARRHRDDPLPAAGAWTFVRPTTTRAVWAVRGHPLAPGPGRRRSPRSATGVIADRHRRRPKPVTGRSPHLCRSTRALGRRHPGGAVVAADRPMGIRAVPAAAADPALAVPPGPGHPRRRPGCAPGPARRHRRGPEPATPAPLRWWRGRCTAGRTRNGHGPGGGPTSTTSPGSMTCWTRSTRGRRNWNDEQQRSW